MEKEHSLAVRRFVTPLIIEHLAVILLNMVYNSVAGNISKSSLSAISTAGLVISMYSALFALISTGGTILTARMIGAHEYKEASCTIEQSLLLTLVYSVIITTFSLLLATPLMKLVIPNADPQLLDEAVSYFRQSAISLPFLFIHTTATGTLRSSGNARANMIINAFMYISLVTLGFVFIKFMGLGITGASLTLGMFRFIGAALGMYVLLRSHTNFIVNIRNIFKPDIQIIKRILRLGMPASMESCFVQLGYLLANTLVMGLGVHQAAIYSVSNAIQSFATMPNGIASPTTSTFVGQYIGANDHARAKRFVKKVLFVGIPVILLLYLIMNLLSPYVLPLYTSDPDVAKQAGKCLWILFLFAIPAQSINTIDPALRSGGDVKFVLFETMVGVWLVRLPLSWLLAYHFDMGVVGIYLANIVSVYVRAIIGFARYLGNKWMYKRV